MKHTVANGRHGVGDGDGIQGFAQSKRSVANARHGVRDGDGLQAYAKAVFVYNCVSMPSKLNGRKVTRKYMRVAEKIKI